MNQNRLIAMSILLLVAGVLIYFIWPKESDISSGTPIVQIIVPTLTTEARAGETLFKGNCVSCHGVNAAGQDGIAPPLVHKIYEPNHHGDLGFQLAAKNGVRAHHWPFGNMPPVEGVSETEVSKIITYVRELQRANGIH